MKALTSIDITQATGECDHQRVIEIEIIFGLFEKIECLEECPNLCNFTMINCRLLKISGLEPVAHTLTRLCLSDQELTKIEGLYLPNLRQLLLQNNKIDVIENLDGVPKLQKLWLTSNRIRKIDSLHHCSDLRELWLQDNLITSITGLEHLTNLHNLALSKNGISHFEELSMLKCLPNLCSLSLSDEHYGTNPITLENGYRMFIVNQLKQIRILDGLEIHSKDQRIAEDEYMKRVLEFNDKIDEVQRAHEKEMLNIDSRRNRNNSHAQLLKQELMTSFRALEDVVMTGRRTINDEHARQQVIRAKYATTLQNKLESIHQEYQLQLEMLIVEETTAMERQEKLFDVLENRILAEEELAISVMKLQEISTASFQHMSDSTPDHRYISSLFLAHHTKDMKVLQLYKCHFPNGSFNPSNQRSPPLFLAGSAEFIQSFLTSVPLERMWLSSDPYLAMFLWNKRQNDSKADHLQLILCHCVTSQPNEMLLPLTNSLEEVYQAICNENISESGVWTKAVYKLSQEKQSQTIYFPPNGMLLNTDVNVQYYSVCSLTPSSIDEAELQRLLHHASHPHIHDERNHHNADSILQECFNRMKCEVEQYQRQLWDDMNPERKRSTEDFQSIQRALGQLRDQIQDEQDIQKSVLKQFNVQKQRRNGI